MAEKRGLGRQRKRLPVRLGTEGVMRMGVTENISEGGLFIRTTSIHRLKTELDIELTTPDNGVIVLQGTVTWVRRAQPAKVRHGNAGGMGIKIVRFLAGEEAYRVLYQPRRFD